MKIAKFFAIAACVLPWHLMSADSAFAARTEPTDDADLNARIAHVKAKAKGRASKVGDKVGKADQLDESKTCGSVDIGNVTTPGRTRQPREVTVIVTGDVINTADCR